MATPKPNSERVMKLYGLDSMYGRRAGLEYVNANIKVCNHCGGMDVFATATIRINSMSRHTLGSPRDAGVQINDHFCSNCYSECDPITIPEFNSSRE